jgi:NADH-ubiquinone oxidoreductase chain 4L
MNLSLILFLIGILGFVLNRKNIILMLISIEIMLLAITFLILISSLSFDDILVAFYRLRGSIAIEYK